MKSPSSRRWDWYLAALMVAIVYTAAARLWVTSWAHELGYVESLAVLGAIVGMLLGASQFKARTAGWLAFGYSLVLIPWQITQIVTGKMTALERLTSTGARLATTLGQLFAAQRIDDPIFFVTLMALLFWAIAVYSGYRLMRYRKLLAVLVLPTIPLLIVQYYDAYHANRIWISAFYFFLVLLLLGRVNLIEKQSVWQAKQVFTGNQPEFELVTSILSMAAGIILLAWLLPTPAAALPAAARIMDEVNQPLKVTRDRLNDMLAAVQGNSRTTLEAYGSTMDLGNDASQGTEEVFLVTPPSFDFPRYHWRMRIYDTYEQGNWHISTSLSEHFVPDDADLSIPGSASGPTADFLFRWRNSTTILLAIPSQPVWVNRAGDIQFAQAGRDLVDVISWHVDQSLQPGDQYTARAVLINPDEASLRNAGTDYPDWVRQHYLQIPEDFPADIPNLAKDLVREQTNPYDRANAITAYLRKEIRYSTNIPSAPPGTEPLSWFLFTWKSGFCNYYASAEVMMLRSVGIPARLAVGYAQGELRADGAYTVREKDAHAWPEVYFTGIGWVDFEPTTSQPAIVRAQQPLASANGPTPTPEKAPATPLPQTPQDDTSLQNGNTIATYQTIKVWVIISVVVLLLAGCLLWLVDRKQPLGQRIPRFVRRSYQRYGLKPPAWLERWERWSEIGLIERSFHAINQSLAWLGSPQPAHATPAERSELLKKILPSVADEIDTLREQHERTLFGPVPGNPARAARAAWRIRSSALRALARRFVGAKDE